VFFEVLPTSPVAFEALLLSLLNSSYLPFNLVISVFNDLISLSPNILIASLPLYLFW